MVLAGLGVVLVSKNVVHSAYGLALALLGIAGVYVFLAAELLAVIQILLYAGGVVILLVFGVMMTNRLKGGSLTSNVRNPLISAMLSGGLFAFLCYLIHSLDVPVAFPQITTNQIEAIGISFLTDHLVAFELIAFILLVALVGAAYLAKMANHE